MILTRIWQTRVVSTELVANPFTLWIGAVIWNINTIVKPGVGTRTQAPPLPAKETL